MVVMFGLSCFLLAGLIYAILWALGEWAYRHYRFSEGLLRVGRWLIVLAVLGLGLSLLTALAHLTPGAVPP